MLFIDEEMARRLEWAESRGGFETAQAMARFRPEMKAAALQIAGGTAVYCGVGSPLTQVLGPGMEGRVTESEVDEMEEFFRSRGSISRVVMCPFADASLLAAMNQRGYRVAEFENTLARSLDDYEPSIAPYPVEVRRVGKGDFDTWARAIAKGFAGEEEPSPMLSDFGGMMSCFRDAVCFMAVIDGEVIGGGTLIFHDEVAALSGAGIVMKFRNRGAQTALLRARLDFAASRGSKLAMVSTAPGTVSQRNAERQGFRIAYTRVAFHRQWS